MRLFIVNLLSISKESTPTERWIIGDIISKINAFRWSIPELAGSPDERETLEYLSGDVFKAYIQESVIEINKSLALLYYSKNQEWIYIDISSIFPKEVRIGSNTYSLLAYRTSKEVKSQVQSRLFLRWDWQVASLASIRTTEERIAKNLWKTQSQDAWEYGALKIEKSIQLNNQQPPSIDPKIQQNIIQRSIKTGDAEMLEVMSHHMQYAAANDNTYDQRKIYAHPRLSMHIRNIRRWKPIHVKTTRWDMDILDIEEYSPWENTSKTYYKAYIIFRWKKQVVILSDESFRVGDISNKIFGVFDAWWNPRYNQIWDNQFWILSIHSHKVGYIKKSPWFSERISNTVSSIRDKVLWIFKRSE